MKKPNIQKSVAIFLLSGCETFRGAMSGQKYYLVSGAVDEHGTRQESQVIRGKPGDIAARLMEEGIFFGDGVDRHYSEIADPNNAQISLSCDGTGIRNGRIVAERSYLDEIGTPEGLKKVATGMGISDACLSKALPMLFEKRE
jgi:hypothetical protein